MERFTREHPGFVDRPGAVSLSSLLHQGGFRVEWSYYRLYSWNLCRRPEREDYLTTDDILCGMRLAIKLSSYRNVRTLIHAIHLSEP